MEYLNLNTENSFSSISKPINYNYKECPQTYRMIDGKCVKVCMSCDTSDESKNRGIWIDPCFPDGIFNALDINGNVCKNNILYNKWTV